MLARLHRNEEGVALITAMLVGMVVLSLGLVTVQLSTHNSNASSLDRKRVQAIHAAEGGLDAYLAQLPVTSLANISCTPAAVTLPISPGVQYRVTAKFYPTYPGVAGQEMSCPLSASTPPAGAIILSKGTASVGSAAAVSRTMETEVRLNPIYGGFNYALWSDTGFNVGNNLTISGNNGNDADVYTNGNFVCSNAADGYGTVTTQGTATLSNSCTIEQDLRAGGSISMSQTSRVGHDATSSTGSISLSNSARIDNNAKVATTCGGCTAGGNVRGTITTGSPSAAPPQLGFPTVNYVAPGTAWTASGYTIRNEINCVTALANITALNGSPTPYVERISPGCPLSLGGSTYSLGANLAIITDGSISTSNHTTIRSSDGQIKNLYLIVPRNIFTPATPPDVKPTSCPASTNDINFANNTDFINVRVFIYTPCVVNISNNNVGDGGQIFGGTVNISNQFTFTYRPMLVPGAGSISGFSPDIAYLREITNS